MEHVTVLTRTQTLEAVECAQCHLLFAIPELLAKELRGNHRTFYCPKGHSLSWNGESALEQERRLRKNAERQRDNAESARLAARDQARAAERSAAATRGHLTRLRRKIENGVCPVPGCQRSFQNVRRHIAGQHPDWKHEHPEVLER